MFEAEKLKDIPAELKFGARWCCWKYRTLDDGRLTKEPYDVKTGYHAKSNDEGTFCSYPELLHGYGVYDGIGIGLFGSYSAVDIDHCVDDGKPSKMAQDIIDYCKSYTELSPSGKGIRIIFKTRDGFSYDKSKYYIKNSEKGLEIYVQGATNRFVTITGNSIGVSSEIREVDLTPILERYMRRDNSLASMLRRDRKLADLWNAAAPGSGADESERDLALCSKLAFYLNGDAGMVREYFERSPYYMSKDESHKKKWERDDYRENTLKMACSGVATISGGIAARESKAQANDLIDGTDTGNAKRFVEMFKDNIRYNCDNKGWMLWNGKYWEFDYTNKIRNYVEVLAESMRNDLMFVDNPDVRKRAYENIRRILNKAGKDALLAEAASIDGMATVNADYNRESRLLNCENGVVDLETGEIIPTSRGQMISQCTHMAADLDHNPKTFIKFMNDMFEGNQRIIDFLMKAFAYSLTDDAVEQEMYILYGDGSNGKSLLLEVMHDILGDYAIMSRPTLLTEQFNGNSSLGAIARLQGKRFVCVEELKPGDRMDESIIKSLTSGYGNIIGKFLYANEFEFNFKGKIFMATNYRPVIRGTDKGIWRRINVIPFRKTFEGKTDDKNLKEKLMAEAPQILGYVIRYYRKYMQEGLIPPEDVVNEVSEYRAEQDVVQRWIDECCELGKGYYCKASSLYANFATWSKANNEYVMSNTLFGRNLAKKFERKQLSTCKVYYGIRIRESALNVERDVAFDRIKVRDDI